MAQQYLYAIVCDGAASNLDRIAEDRRRGCGDSVGLTELGDVEIDEQFLNLGSDLPSHGVVVGVYTVRIGDGAGSLNAFSSPGSAIHTVDQ